MRKYLVITICLSVALLVAACSPKNKVIEGFSSPESVTSDGYFFFECISQDFTRFEMAGVQRKNGYFSDRS